VLPNNVSPATANFHATALSVTNLSIANATTLEDSAAVTVSGAMAWQGGTLTTGTVTGGSLTVQNTGTLTLNNGDYVLDGETLTNLGTATWTSGSIQLDDGAVINNAGTLTMALNYTWGMSYGFGAAGVVNNSGTWIDASGNTYANSIGTYGGITFNNSGSMQVQSGTLNLDYGGNGGTSSGSFSAAPGSSLNLGGAALTLTPPAQITGDSITLAPTALNLQISDSLSGALYPAISIGSTGSIGGQLNVQVQSGFTPTLGETLTLIHDQGSSPVNGTFTGLPEGASVTDNQGNRYQITYRGGSGNDVVLTTTYVATLPTVTAVSSDHPQGSVYGQAVTFTATVATTPQSNSTPTGSVQFQIDGSNAGSAVTLTGGSASFSTSTLTVGTHTIGAFYSGAASYFASSGSLTETVLSAQQEVSVIGTQVNNLVNAGALSSGNGSALTVKLDNATASLNGGHTNAGINQIRAFINQINAFVSSGTLTAAQGQALTSAAKAAITAASGSGSFQLALGASSAFASSNSNQILNGVLTMAVQDDTGNGLDPNEVARLGDALTCLNAALGSFGVDLTWAAPGTNADVHIHLSANTPQGGASDGVLGFTTAENDLYLVTGWNFYTGADASAIGAGQYDFLTLATHELAHTVGLGESNDPNSVMYEYLAAGSVRRTFTDANLALINTDADRFMKAGGTWDARNGPQASFQIMITPVALQPASLLLAGMEADGQIGPGEAMGAPVAANNVLIRGGDNVLIGGAGDDILIGGTGRDILIGGFGSTKTAGPSGDKVHLSVELALDHEGLAWRSIMGEWTSDHDGY
jgi:hypothetical protein